jgi:glycosyltransferase involved in cell wall biosynthesis
MHLIHYYPWGCFYPASCGADTVAVQQLEYFKARGWKVDLVVAWSPKDSALIQQFRDHYSWVNQITFLDIPALSSYSFEGLLAAYCQLKSSNVLARAFMTPADLFFANYFFTAPLLDLLPRTCKRVLETHDLYTNAFYAHAEFLTGRDNLPLEPLDVIRKRFLIQVETSLFHYYDATIMIQPEELAHVQKLQECKAFHVPRWYPLGPAPSANADPDYQFDLLFVGSDHYLNQDGVNWFYQHVYEPYLSQDQVRWGLVGRIGEQARFAGPGIRKLGVLGGGPQILAETYASSKIVIVPIRKGTGISIKTLEALAMGRAVISTPVGARGLCRPEEGMVCVDMEANPRAMADRIRQLLGATAKRRLLEQAARAYMAKYHSLEANFAAMDHVLGSVGLNPSAN